MRNSLLNKFSFVVPLVIFFSSCNSTQYKIYHQDGALVGLVVSPDRVLVECELQEPSDRFDVPVYGFMIQILDEENTVLTAIQTTQTDKSDCFEKLRLSESIQKKSSKVYIGGRTNLNKKRIIEPLTYTFPKHGTFHDNGRVMDFQIMKGEDGLCVTAHDGYGKPCPEVSMFPVEHAPF